MNWIDDNIEEEVLVDESILAVYHTDRRRKNQYWQTCPECGAVIAQRDPEWLVEIAEHRSKPLLGRVADIEAESEKLLVGIIYGDTDTTLYYLCQCNEIVAIKDED